MHGAFTRTHAAQGTKKKVGGGGVIMEIAHESFGPIDESMWSRWWCTASLMYISGREWRGIREKTKTVLNFEMMNIWWTCDIHLYFLGSFMYSTDRSYFSPSYLFSWSSFWIQYMVYYLYRREVFSVGEWDENNSDDHGDFFGLLAMIDYLSIYVIIDWLWFDWANPRKQVGFFSGAYYIG